MMRLPLTAAQEGIWRGQLLDPSSTAYVTAECVELPPRVDVAALSIATTSALAEAEALTVRVIADGVRGYQVSGTPIALPRSIDLADRSQADAWMARDLSVGFDLTKGPLVRHAILRVGEQAIVWYVAAHHLAVDGYAFSLLFGRAAELYGAQVLRRAPTPSRFPPLASIIEEDLAYRSSEAARVDGDYLRARLTGVVDPGSLVARLPDAPSQPRRVSRHLVAQERAALDADARARGPGWLHALTALFASFLQQRSDCPEVVLGLPVLGRSGAAALRAPMMMMNIAPLRLALRPERSLRDAADTVKRELDALLPHARYRYEQLRRDLGRVGGDRRLFGPVLNFIPFATGHRFGEHEGKVRAISAGPVEDLSVSIRPCRGGLDLTFDGHPEVYAEASLNTLIDEFVACVRLHASEPERALSMSVARASERVVQGEPLHAPARDVISVLLDCVRAHGEREAVRDGTSVLRYDELLARIVACAEALSRAQVREGALVGLALPRGVDAVVAIFAVLWRNAAYLPIDPQGPWQRNANILAEAAPALVITPEWMASEVAAIRSPGHVETTATSAAPYDAARPAYVIYTSGSTGRPNGVIVGRGALAHFVAAARQRYAFDERDRILQFAPLSFDAAVEEIFVALTSGATLVLRAPDMTDSVLRFLRRCAELEVTVLDLPTAFFHELAFALAHGAAMPSGVHTVIIGGEAAVRERVAEFLRATRGKVRLLNTYGPTEATVVATASELRASGNGVELAIGLPLPGVTAILRPQRGELLDPRRYELLLAGPTLALGYVGEREASRRFVELEHIGRAYQTGDLVHLLADGQLAFAGRVDDQLKISGHRIELKEVEQVVHAHPAVREAAVVVVGERGAPKLVAHVALADERVSLAELREHARARLLTAAVPSEFVVHAELPKTPSGKVDRQRLRAHRLAALAEDAHLSPLEQTIREVFREVLRRDGVPVDADFFELGGQSLETIQAASRLSVLLRREIAGALLFRHPTVRSLAEALRATDAPAAWEQSDAPRELMRRDAESLEVAPIIRATRSRGGVLLTGATGFLGPYLLRELLLAEGRTVVCLVRASDVQQGTARLRDAWERAGFAEPLPIPRVRVLLADLAKPRLGLDERTLAALAEACARVVHNGASVSLARGYSSLRSVNVAATRELIALARAMRGGTIDYVSTVAAAQAGAARPLPEQFVPEHDGLCDGYSQSKWTSECLLRRAAEAGLNVRVFRLARLIGPLGTGAIHRDDLVWRVLSAGIAVGALPLLNVAEPWTPVDVIARAIARAADVAGDARVFNLVPRERVSLDEWMRFVAAQGYRVTLSPPEQFSLQLEREAAKVDPATLAMLENLARRPPPALGPIATGEADRIMARLGLRFPAIDRSAFARFFARGVREGVLPPPILATSHVARS